MVRNPNKSCPNLSRLFDDAEMQLLAGFLTAAPFQKFGWLEQYRFDPDDAERAAAAREMLHQETKLRLDPLETEAARIVTVSGRRGQFALDGLARTRLDADRSRDLLGQRDEIARSLWTWLEEHGLFEAVENSLHMRLYRRYDRHYQTFPAEPVLEGDRDTGRAGLDRLLEKIGQRLDRGEGYDIDRYDLPADGDEPAAEMYLLYHPNPPTSVREIDEEGNRSRIYFRPPGEAMIVFIPSTGRVHVRAGSRALRHDIAECFIETALKQTLSHQPVDFQAYDISRFLEGFDLALPELEDVTLLSARVIRAEVSIGSLATRLALSTTIDQEISGIIAGQPGIGHIFAQAIAIRFVEIAVRYRRAGRDEVETLDFTLTDRNTSSLMSLEDAFERVLGHRLLRHWGILQEGRAPDAAESAAMLPALLALWNSGAGRVTGAWLLERRIDPALLTELGFLAPAGWEDHDLIDDEDAIGQTAAEVVVRPGAVDLRPGIGYEAPAGPAERYRVYRVRGAWVAQHMREQAARLLDVPAVSEIGPHLLALGTLAIDGRDVPVWLARGLQDERVRAAVDAELRARHALGIGLVLDAGDSAAPCIAANVLTPLAEHVDGASLEISLMAESLRTVFRRNHALAQGGQVVELRMSGEHAGTLFVPGKGTIDIVGAHRLLVIRRLVDAHNAGPTPVKTQDLIKGIEGQSLANIFKQPLWTKLKADFLRSRGAKGPWEIAI